MDIKVLASASDGNAYLVSDGTTHLLIECGIPYNELKVKTNFFELMPAACLISHSHGDHLNCPGQLIRLGIPCYMSQQTFAERGGDLPPLEVKIIEHNKRFSIGTFEVLPLEMRHDVYCLGFYLYSKALNESLFFATDTCLIPYKLPPMDYIMVEANYDINILNDRIMSGYIDPSMKPRLSKSHMEIESTVLWLSKQDLSKTKRIYLLHLSHGSSNAEDFKRRVIECTGTPTTIAGG